MGVGGLRILTKVRRSISYVAGQINGFCQRLVVANANKS